MRPPAVLLLLALCPVATGCSFIRTRPIERTESGQVICSNSRIPAYVDMGIGLAMHAALTATALSRDANDATVSLASFGQLLPVVLVLPSMIHGFVQASRCSRALEEQWNPPPVPPVPEPLREVPRVDLPMIIPVPPGCTAPAIQRASVAALRRAGLEVTLPLDPDPVPVSAWRVREPGRCGRIQFRLLGGPLAVRMEIEVEAVGRCSEPQRLSGEEEIWLYRIREHLENLLEACRTAQPPAPTPEALPSDLPRELQLPQPPQLTP